MKYTRIDYLNDCNIIQSFAPIVKTAEETPSYVSSLISQVGSYFSSKVSGDITPSRIINFMSPAVIYQLFSFFNMKWIGLVAGLLTQMFNVDVSAILSKVISGIKSLVASGASTSSSEVKSVIDSAFSGFSITANLTEDQLIKLAYGKYDESTLSKVTDAIKDAFGGSRASIGQRIFSIFKTAITWFFMTALSALGFMVAGDAIGSFIKKFVPSAGSMLSSVKDSVTGILPTGKPDSTESNFENKNGWVENIQNNKNNIINLVLDYVSDKYKDADESKVSKSPMFIGIVKSIIDFNRGTPNYKFVLIPNNFKSPDDIADRIMSSLKEQK